MMKTVSASTPNSFVSASYLLLFAGLVSGTVIAPLSLRVAILPIALIFGWAQIGGL
jgi:hypothetical protein